MATQLLTEKYAEHLDGVLGCYDRIVIIGSLAELCYAKGMTDYLYAHDIRIFDYARFGRTLAGRYSRQRRAAGPGAGSGDRVYPEERLPQGRPHPGDPSPARPPARPGAYLQRDGTVCLLPALA